MDELEMTTEQKLQETKCRLARWKRIDSEHDNTSKGIELRATLRGEYEERETVMRLFFLEKVTSLRASFRELFAEKEASFRNDPNTALAVHELHLRAEISKEQASSTKKFHDQEI